MGRIFIKREDAKNSSFHTPVLNDKLETILAKCEAGITWQELAIYNWGTDDPKEVNRALIETVGVRTVDDADPSKSVLDPALGPDGAAGKILLPKTWKKDGLALEKHHKITIKPLRPAPAIRINTLDKWFIPGDETCAINYGLEGIKERADKVDFEVYGSNYCKATAAADGEFLKFTYAALDIPLWKEKIGDGVDSRRSADVPEWRGRVDPGDGILKKRGATDRLLTVANSPYTVLLRYYRKAADEKARIVLDAFWPEWKKPGPGFEDDSVKIKWEIKDSNNKLTMGQLMITDKDNNVVHRAALPPSKLADGKHTYDKWNPDSTVIVPDKLPYRVQIQAHSNMEVDDGLALSVMHTEVRLYAHSDVNTHPTLPAEAGNYDKGPIEDSQCFDIAVCRRFLPDQDSSPPAVNSAKWIKLQLAKAGYYPGPVNADAIAGEARNALKEFQRSVPKPLPPPRAADDLAATNALAAKNAADLALTTDPTNAGLIDAAAKATEVHTAAQAWAAATIYSRLRADGSDTDADTLAVLATAAAGSRPMFSKSDRSDCTLDEADTRLKNKNESLIVWTDDRNIYTTPQHAGSIPATSPNMGMEDYRGGMSIGDAKVDRDRDSVARPWIPLELSLPLLSKSDPLYPTTPPRAVTANMRNAIGPLRVDWTFTEIGEDLSVVDTSQYDAARVRLRAYIDATVKRYPGTHNGKTCTNCPSTFGGVDLGGIRPEVTNSYYSVPFGLDTASLQPWKAHDSGNRSICTVTHFDSGDQTNQLDNKLFADYIGKAGVYLHLSNIGGDGYRFRAAVQFDELASVYDHPNWRVLKARYTKRPQAHTCKLRVWRRASLRGYVLWGLPGGGNWNTFRDGAAALYRPAFLHFIHESGAPADFPLNSLITAADEDAYKNVVRTYSTKAEYQILNRMSLSTRYVWPWCDHKHLGVIDIPGGTDLSTNYEETFLNPTVWNPTWRKFREPLMFYLLDRIERKEGKLRGHVIVEFDSSPTFYKQLYYCNAVAKHPNILIEKVAAGGSAVGDACHVTGCAGILEGGAYKKQYRCPTGHKTVDRYEPTAAAQVHVCGRNCTGTLQPQTGSQVKGFFASIVRMDVVQKTYECSECHRTVNHMEPPGSTARAGEVCGQACARNMAMTSSTGPLIIESAYHNLPFPAAGVALGATWIFREAGNANAGTWAHELGHHRHLQHAAMDPAAAASNGVDPLQHDSRDNTGLAAVAALSGKPGYEKQWDRCCIMSYTFDNGGADRLCFCGKCILKNRGWKVQQIPNPASGVAGP
jgi:hypothetical protein